MALILRLLRSMVLRIVGILLAATALSFISLETEASSPPAEEQKRLAALARMYFGQDAEFTALVFRNDYTGALAHACRKFELPCDQHRIKINTRERSGSYATTHPYTDTIRLNRTAFEYLGRPHPGWLAALLSHEMVHAGQSRYIRSIVLRAHESLLRDHYWTAVIELEAWNAMLEQADRFRLNCAMRLEIQDNLSYFSAVLERRGKAPRSEAEESEHYQLPNRSRRAYEQDCEIRLEALTSPSSGRGSP